MKKWGIVMVAAWGAVAVAQSPSLSRRQAEFLGTVIEVAATNTTQALAMVEAEIGVEGERPREPLPVPYHLVAAQLYSAEGLFTNAVAQFRIVVRQEPNNAEALVGLGRALLGTGQSVSAEGAYRAALLAAEGDALRDGARAGLIHALVAQSRLAEAEAALAEHITQRPEDPALRRLMAQIREARGDAEGAAVARECAERLEEK